jgi:hypothetical protein
MLGDESRLFRTMCDEDMLQAVYPLDFRGIWIDPIHFLFYLHFSECLLVFGAQVASQIHSPTTIAFAPPIEIYMKACLKSRLDETETFPFCQLIPPESMTIFTQAQNRQTGSAGPQHGRTMDEKPAVQTAVRVAYGGRH